MNTETQPVMNIVDKNFLTRLKAAVDERMNETGLMGVLLRGLSSYDEGEQIRRKFFNSIDEEFLEYLHCRFESLPQSNNEVNTKEEKLEFMKWLMDNRLFFVDEVRQWLRQYDKEEISFSKFVELFNEKVFLKYHNQFHNKEEVSENELLDEIEEKLSIQLSRGHGLVANIIQLLKQHYSIIKK